MTLEKLPDARIDELLKKASELNDQSLSEWISKQEDAEVLGQALLDLMRPQERGS